MTNDIKNVLKTIQFAQQYSAVCVQYPDADSGMVVSNKIVEKHLQKLKHKATYHYAEKSFTKDYKVNKYWIKFILSFEDGLVEAFYAIEQQDYSDNHIFGRFDALAKLENPDFESTIKYNVPIATNTKELYTILKEILKLNKQFIAFLQQ
ncbi:MAG: hypothetical protein V3V14_07445 [Saprospiraceae bacterium]